MGYTLEEIARLAGVSRSTVSRVINHHPSVRPEVRERVWRIIREVGYQPHAAARNLATRRSQIVGVVIPEALPKFFSDPYFPAVLRGISDALTERGYHLMLSLLSPQQEEDFYQRALRGRLVDGIIVISAQITDPLIRQAYQEGLPVISVGRYPQEPGVSYVDVDNVGGGRMATDHLLRLGRRRIATIAGPQTRAPGIDRLEGYRAALRAWGIDPPPEWIAEGDFTEIGGYVAMRRLLSARPDAVFAASDLMAVGAMKAIREAGLRIPEDIAIVGYDDVELARFTDPPLTTVRQPIYELGRIAVRLLLSQLEEGAREPQQVVLPTELVIRASCGALQERGAPEPRGASLSGWD
ncbi:LacI family DNA-binding transcriptional regulator [Thermoflexus sp.]|uniref:LacI family DNA-binding transcriptional regulator n=1 Tax=Thermoflexus sp. TaxID=1969742 RepID=UPI002ADD7D63|nr:LacI family DNA-binding transcriptional regulator [Thermoflexus sp.]